MREVVAVERRRDAGEEEHDDLDLVGRLDAGGAQPREDDLLTITYSLLCNGEQTDNNNNTATATTTNRKAYLDVGDRNVAEGLEAHLPMHAYASAMTT